MDKIKLEEYKKKYSKIYQGKYIFTDHLNNTHELTYHFRKPTLADMEIYQQTAAQNLSAANQNLVSSLLVDEEEKKKVLEVAKEYPGIIAKIVDGFLPFFGLTGKIETQEV